MRYYFVSNQNFNGEILYPRIPENRMNKEDSETKRICVSQSIDGCLVATYYDPEDIIYVHYCESDKVTTPTVKQVEDAPITGEQWILESVEMKLFMILKITDVIKRSLGMFGTMPINTYRYVIERGYSKE